MDKQEFLFNLLLENILMKCRYYQGDEDTCLKYGYLDSGASWPTCNCEGNIKDCDLYDWAKIENLIK